MSTPSLHIEPLAKKDLLSLADCTRDEILRLFRTAAATKRDITPFQHMLSGKSVVLLFEKPSLRTRLTFQVGPYRLGAQSVYMEDKIGEREPVQDYGRNLDRWVHAIVARVHEHAVLKDLAKHCSVPIINALSEHTHPCQGLADFFTLWQRNGETDDCLAGFHLAYVGDGNNVCHSLMHCGALLGAKVTAITPPGRECDPAVVARAKEIAQAHGGSIETSTDLAAAKGANAIYTDKWVSMGDTRGYAGIEAFEPYRVTEKAMAGAAPNAVFMHCLPADRGKEAEAAVVDSPQSVIYDQAENRLHVQNAILLHTMLR